MRHDDGEVNWRDAQPDRAHSVRWWHQMWQGSNSRFVHSLEQVQTQWELYEVVKFEYLADLFPDTPGTRSLECGCGSAGVSAFFARRGYATAMLDFAPSALDLARRNFREHALDGQFVHADSGRLPLTANSFDVVMSYGLVEHFADPQPFIDEMVRVLKPGGLLFADIVPRRFNVQTLAHLLFNPFAVVTYGLMHENLRWTARKLYSLFVPEYYENSFSLSEYREFMGRAGLERISITGNNPFPRLYLPDVLDKHYIRLLIGLLPLWRRFDQSRGWFLDEIWARAWWAHGYKPQGDQTAL